MKKKRRSNHAVSEVLATVLLLGITIALFGFLNYIVFSFSFESPAPSVSLIGSFSADGTHNNITIEHNGGESLDGNTEIIITVGATTNKSTVRDIIDGTTDWKLLPLKDDKNPDKWDFGETIQFNSRYDFTDTIIQASVMDPSTNTLILSVVLQHGPATSVITNKPPTITTPLPTNGSTGNLLGLTWKIQIDDPENDPFTWTIQCSNGQTNNGAGPNGQKTLILTGLSYSTTYKILVNATDPTGSNLFTRKWYTFTTTGNLPPAFGTPTPSNGSINQPLNLPWNIPINDLEGNPFTWTTQCSNGQTNSAAGATNGTKTLSLSGLSHSTTYRIWVNATDPTGSGLWTRRWYTLTTKTSTVINLKPNLVYDNTSGSDYTLTPSNRLNLNLSDNLKYRSQAQWTNNFGKRIEFNFPDIPTGATVINVTLKFEWNITGTAGTTNARLMIYNGSNWQVIALIPSTTDVIVTKYLLGNINNAAKVNSLKIWFQVSTNKNYYTWNDWVQVDVTYTQ
ncbi:MAG TPA: type IV pilin N-terminal domain-containing protein [Candidatus Thermoplasmatota archaeon]|nr:type IV pilin N-terminal domain-containing protein [Candidatus Thermoplasmatota archaeon]